MSDKAKKDWWDKFQVMTNFAGVVVLGFVGLLVNSTIQSRDANAKLMETAVGVLRAKPEESNKGLRAWAIGIVNKYSQVPLSWEAQEELKTNALPQFQQENPIIGSGGPISGSSGPIYGSGGKVTN